MEMPTTPTGVAILVLTTIGGSVAAAVKAVWNHHVKQLADCKLECREREAKLTAERNQALAEARANSIELALTMRANELLREKLARRRDGSSRPPPSS
jgi:hypothetical protein